MSRLAVLGVAALLAACGSPEASRVQGGDAGADLGNRGSDVRMHEGSQPYHGTPMAIPAEGASTEAAGHAYGFSRP